MGSTVKFLYTTAASGLFQQLAKKPSGNIQRRDGSKRDVNHFTMAKLFPSKEETILKGMMSGPDFEDLRFSIIKTTDWEIQISAGSRKVEEAIEIVKQEVIRLFAASQNRKPNCPINKDNWDGYYMESRPAGDKGKEDLTRAIKEGLVSEEFAKQALEWGFSMYERHPKLK